MGSSASQYFEIPKYFVFSEKGIFSGSASEKDFNYKVVPVCPKEGDKCLKGYIWSGDNCLEKTENVMEREFPFSEEGHRQLLDWFESEYLSREEVIIRPERQKKYAKELTEKYVSLDDFFAQEG